jgi:hypothetical protein
VEDLSGVEKVEFGFDLDDSGGLEEKEKPVVARQPGPDGKWTAVVPTGDVVPGRHILLVRAVDRIGLVGRPQRVLIAIEPASKVKPKSEMPETGTIEGRVLLIDRPVSGFQVRLEQAGRSAVSDDDGRFVFRDVPPGTYKLVAKGVALNQRREGSGSVIVKAAKTPATVTIQVE